MREIDELMNRNQIPILENILKERIKQDVKWGEQNHLPLRWFVILMEEVGEISKNLNETFPCGEKKYSNTALRENLKYELEQVAAVCLAWREAMERETKVGLLA